MSIKLFSSYWSFATSRFPTRGRWELKRERERPVEGVRITDSSHLTPDPRSALPGALLQHTYWLLSLEKVRDKKKKKKPWHCTLPGVVGDQHRHPGEKGAQRKRTLQGWEQGWSTLWIGSSMRCRWSSRSLNPASPECFWVSPPWEERQMYLSVPKCSFSHQLLLFSLLFF